MLLVVAGICAQEGRVLTDVQPAMEREWRTDPFEVTAVNGYLYGRGTSDNKVLAASRRAGDARLSACSSESRVADRHGVQGPILGFVYAVKEMQEAVDGELPFNVAFVFEGEEENGSKVGLACRLCGRQSPPLPDLLMCRGPGAQGFKEAVQTNLHWFEGTQLIVISNTLWVGEQVRCGAAQRRAGVHGGAGQRPCPAGAMLDVRDARHDLREHRGQGPRARPALWQRGRCGSLV